MKLLEKVVAAGYKVTDHKNSRGTRFITIQSPDGKTSWTRYVFPANITPDVLRLRVQSLQERCRHYISHPVNRYQYR